MNGALVRRSRSDAAGNVLATIGSTPLVRLARLRAAGGIHLYAKLEATNPGGSIKDRVALAMVEEAERHGQLRPGRTIIERTSGNMGTGLALVCALKGYRFVAVMSAGNTVERRRMMAALGAEVVIVPQAPGGTAGHVSAEDLQRVEARTRELERDLGAYRPDQFNNPANAAAHERTTGPEIWDQTQGRVDAFVAYVGTGGTFTGISRALKRRNPQVQAFVVEPASAPFLAGGTVTSTHHQVQGGGYAFRPAFWDPPLCDGFLTVTDEEAIRTARELAKQEGILAGFSGGANVAAACKLRDQFGDRIPAGSSVVTILPDSGMKYLSTELFD